MENKACFNNSENRTLKEKGVTNCPPSRVLTLQEERDVVPAHLLLKVKSYSLLPTEQGEKYESNFFNFDGYPYRWKLILYPHGDSTSHGKDHISLYLAIDENTLPRDGTYLTVCVDLRFFVLNKNTEKYLTIQDAKGTVMCFDKLRTVQGFSQIISLDKFNDPKNGYLVDDACTFGAEFFIIQPSRRTRHEAITLFKDPSATTRNGDRVFKESDGKTFTWKIVSFLARGPDEVIFDAAGRGWSFYIYPKGDAHSGNRGFMSLYFWVHDHPRKVYVKTTLRVVNHPGTPSKEKVETISRWFDASFKHWEKPDFTMQLSDIREFLWNTDTLLIQIKFDVISDIN